MRGHRLPEALLTPAAIDGERSALIIPIWRCPLLDQIIDGVGCSIRNIRAHDSDAGMFNLVIDDD